MENVSSRPRPSDILWCDLCKIFSHLEDLKLKNSSWSQSIPEKQRRIAKDRAVEALCHCARRETHEMFDIARLVLPQLDDKRGSYFMKEKALGEAFIIAMGLSKDDPKAIAVRHWRNPGVRNAGNISTVLREYLFAEYCPAEKEIHRRLTVGDINRALDSLVQAASEGYFPEETEENSLRRREKQAASLRPIISRGTAEELYWVSREIMKDMKIGLGEKYFFDKWHPDALERYNATMNLQAVFNEMVDPSQPWKVDITPGQPARSQNARSAHSTEEVWYRMHIEERRADQSGLADSAPGKRKRQGIRVPPESFLCETKFDGERIQAHRCGAGNIKYFSRRAIEHGQRSDYHYLNEALVDATNGHDQLILDGEVVIWNRARQIFEPFGTIRPVIQAIKDSLPKGSKPKMDSYSGVISGDVEDASDAPLIEDLEILYIAFDVLFVDTTSVTKLPLRERLGILEDVVRPTSSIPVSNSAICARIVPLIPNRTTFHAEFASKIAYSHADIQMALQRATEQHEEGIICKSLDSIWKSDDRSDSWVKIKPDYLENIELDCVVLGGFYGGGQGRRSGTVTQWLLGILENREGTAKFKTFCRVGSGFGEEENSELIHMLKHLFVEGKGGTTNIPPNVSVAKEKPDIWISDPSKSVVVVVKADLRLVRGGGRFATEFTTRFPRALGLHPDKTPALATTEDELRYGLEERIEHGIQRSMEGVEGPFDDGRKDLKVHRLTARDARIHVPSSFKPQANLEDVPVKSRALEGCQIWFANYHSSNPYETSVPGNGDEERIENAEKLVHQLSGTVWKSFSPKAITHIVAARPDSRWQYLSEVSSDQRDVFQVGWLLRCHEEGRLVRLLPRDYLFRSKKTRDELSAQDEYGDPYYIDIGMEDVRALLVFHMTRKSLSAFDVLNHLVVSLDSIAGGVVGGSPADLRSAHTLHQSFDSILQQDEQEILAKRSLTDFMDQKLKDAGAIDRRFYVLRPFCVAICVAVPPSITATDTDRSNARSTLLSRTVELDNETARICSNHQKLQKRRVSMLCRLHGAMVVDCLKNRSVTHLIVITTPTEVVQYENLKEDQASDETKADAFQALDTTNEIHPKQLLEAVYQQLGGSEAIGCLRDGLRYDSIRIVSHEWIDSIALQSTQEKRSAEGDGAHAILVSESEMEYPVISVADVLWPWEEYSKSQMHSDGISGVQKEDVNVDS